MADYRLSSSAERDLTHIAEFSIDQFGIKQAGHYRDGLETCLRNLAQTPGIGRNADELAPGLRRYQHRSHVIFYKPTAKGVHIVRVLHDSMDVARHL